MTGKRSPDDILGDLDASEAEEAADKRLGMTPEQRAESLASEGVTRVEIEAAGDAWHERMQRAAVEDARARAEAEARQALVGPRKPSRWALALAAAAVLVALAAAMLVRPRDVAPVALPTPEASVPLAPAESFEAGTQDAALRDAAPGPAPPWGKKPPLR